MQTRGQLRDPGWAGVLMGVTQSQGGGPKQNRQLERNRRRGMGWIGWRVCMWDECVLWVCVCMGHRCAWGVFACVCLSVCVLCMSAPLSTHAEVLGGNCRGSQSPQGPTGPPVRCNLHCPPAPVTEEGVCPSPVPSRPPFSPPPAVIDGTTVLISNHFLQFAK